MAISGDYAQPVNINGFSCRNCTDVAYANKHIDPEHPKSGPFGINADTDPSLAFKRAVTPVTTADMTAPGRALNILA